MRGYPVDAEHWTYEEVQAQFFSEFVAGDGRYLEDEARIGRIRGELRELGTRALGEGESREVIERVAARLEGRYPTA